MASALPAVRPQAARPRTLRAMRDRDLARECGGAGGNRVSWGASCGLRRWGEQCGILGSLEKTFGRSLPMASTNRRGSLLHGRVVNIGGGPPPPRPRGPDEKKK